MPSSLISRFPPVFSQRLGVAAFRRTGPDYTDHHLDRYLDAVVKEDRVVTNRESSAVASGHIKDAAVQADTHHTVILRNADGVWLLYEKNLHSTQCI